MTTASGPWMNLKQTSLQVRALSELMCYVEENSDADG